MPKKTNILTRIYPLKSVYHIFLLSAFPFHLWALLMIFRDFEWVAVRTNLWDAIGLASYALTFALIETVFFLFFLLLFGLLVPLKWETNLRIILIGTIGLLISTWAILGQAFYLFENSLPVSLFNFFIRSGHPLRILWILISVLVTLSVAIPTVMIIKSEKARKFFGDFYERITLLSVFYLLFDMAGIIIILIRNIHV